jgi:hypothetical protein
MLWYIRRRRIHGRYDYIVFSSFDEIPLYFSGIKGNLLLFTHANVAGLDNPIKRWFLKRIARRGRLIVFHEFIKRRCEEFGIRNVLVEPQGLSEPYVMDDATTLSTLRSLDGRLASGVFSQMLFAPTGSKYADVFLKEAIGDRAFTQFLAERRIGVVIKDDALRSSSENIIILSQHLSDTEYKALFVASTAIILSYPMSFNYRISAALFECFSNSKPCLLSDIEGFKVYEPHFTYKPYFSNPGELMAGIDALSALPVAVRQAPYRDLQALVPTFSALIE